MGAHRTLGTRNRPALTPRVGRVGQHVVAIERGHRHVLAPHGPDASACEVGGTPVVSTCCTSLGVREDVGELMREQIDLGIRQLEVREPGDAQHFLSRELR